jgi:hypothetical protein
MSEGNPVWRDKAVYVRKPWQETSGPVSAADMEISL